MIKWLVGWRDWCRRGWRGRVGEREREEGKCDETRSGPFYESGCSGFSEKLVV